MIPQIPCPFTTVNQSCRILLTGLLLGVSTTLAQSEGNLSEEAVALPPFVVDEPTRPLRWHYVSLPDFELITTGSSATARDFAVTYYRQEQLVRHLVPDKYLWKSSVPTMHILVDESRAKRVTDEAIREFFENSKGAPNSEESVNKFLPNLRLQDVDSNIVFIQHDSRGQAGSFNLMDLYFGHSPSRSGGINFAFTTSRIAFLLERRTPTLPAWFIVGMVGLYQQSGFTQEDIHVSATRWGSPAEADALRSDPLRPRATVPLRRFLSGPPSAKPGNEATRKLWREYATLFVHWAMFADEQAHRDGLWEFIDRLEREPLSESLFTECFGLGYTDARNLISDYLPIAVQVSHDIDPGRLASLPTLRVRDASSVDVARIRGEWERLEVEFVREHHPDLVDAYLDHARRNMEARERNLGADPDVLGARGLLEYDAGNTDLARSKLEAAIAAGASRPSIAQRLAQLRFDEARHRTPADQKLSPADTGLVLAPLEIALSRKPALAENYTLLADLWLNSEMSPTQRDLEVLEDGINLFSSNTAVVGRVALVYAVSGEVDQAISLVELGMEHARSDSARQTYRRLRDQLFMLRTG